MSTRPARCIVAVLLSAASLTACRPDGGGGGGTGADTNAGAATSATPSTPDPSGSVPTPGSGVTLPNGCPLDHVRPVDLQPVSPAYASLVASLKACTDPAGSSLWVRNDSFVVWRVDRPYLPPDFGPSGDRTVDVFRELASRRRLDRRVLEPKQSVSFSLVQGMQLWPDDAATSLWQTVVAMDEVSRNRGLGRISEVFAGDSEGRQAVAECGLAGWDAAQYVRDLGQQQRLSEQAPVLLVQKQIGLASGVTGCGRAVEEWQTSRAREVPAAGALAEEMDSQLVRRLTSGFFGDIVLHASQMLPRVHG